MTHRAGLLGFAMTLTLAAASVAAQVDQAWLRMWTEAQTHKPSQLATSVRIAPESEPGTPLAIHGRVLAPDGKTPAARVVVFAYQTGADGLYSSPEKPGRPWRLQGWAVTDADGRFEFRTIRPAPYPGGKIPAHVHLTVETAAYGRQWTEELRFDDDRFVTAAERKASAALGAFANVLTPTTRDGVQHVDVRIRLKTRADF